MNMSLMNLLFSLHKFTQFSIGISPKHCGGRSSTLTKSPKVSGVVVHIYDNYIETHGNVFGHETPLEFLHANNNMTFLGVIEWFKECSFLASQVLKSSFKIDDA